MNIDLFVLKLHLRVSVGSKIYVASQGKDLNVLKKPNYLEKLFLYVGVMLCITFRRNGNQKKQKLLAPTLVIGLEL